MAPTLVVGAATGVATAMLSREIEFKVIQLAALGSYVVGYLIVGVGAALAGLGVWSLVLAWHVQTVLACIALCVCSPRSLLPANPFKSLRIANFGVVVMVTNMINWLIDLGPHTAIGRSLGASMLGQYTLASNLVKVPADHLVKNLQSVLFPLAARAQNNDAGLRRAYLSVLAAVGVISFPVFVFVATMSHPIVLLLLGPKWSAAAEVLAPLSLAMIGHAVEALCGPILGGRGDPKVELRVKAVTLAVMLLTLAITATWSLAAVAWGVAFVYLLRWLWMNAAVMTRLNISVREFADAMRGPFVLGAVSWAVATGVNAAFGALAQSVPGIWVLASAAVCAAVILVATLLTLPRIALGTHLLALLDQLVEQRPAIARIPGLRRMASFAARATP
jgi:PST family polysaccharide transporter